MSLYFKNYFSTLLFIFIVYFFYNSVPFYQNFFNASYSFPLFGFEVHSSQIFKGIITIYICILPIFYLFHNEKSKALQVIEYLIRKGGNFSYKASKSEKTSFLAWIVKGFWAPLMIFWIVGHIGELSSKGFLVWEMRGLSETNFLGFFDAYFFLFCFSAILFIDVFFFTCGYLIESPYLKNTIRSVEPTLLGWFVTLACYPPFNTYTNKVLGWYSNDFPHFENPTMHISLNITLLILMAIYAWASFSLGWKASNLTNRGIVAKGPYRFVRHPAYIAKNTAWWIGGLPFIMMASSQSDWEQLTYILFGLSGWTFLYFMRAWTEERHLSKDPEYREYKSKVRYRFIPGVY